MKNDTTQKKPWYKRWWIITIGIIILFYIIGSLSSDGSKSNSEPPSEAQNKEAAQNANESKKNLNTGETGVLSVDGKDILVGIEKEDFDKIVKSSVAGDTYGIVEIVAQGKAFYVKDKTKVLIIDRDTFSRQVRILEGDMTGKTGWVPYEFIK